MAKGRIGVMTGGGDTTALNATLKGIALEVEKAGCETIGIQWGWAGMLSDGAAVQLPADAIDENRGGTIIRSSRTNLRNVENGMEQAVQRIADLKLDGFVAIGGDDTLTVGAALGEAARATPVNCVTKTIDNDVGANAPADQPLNLEHVKNYYCPGFITAAQWLGVQTAALRTTAYSHGRIMALETMGRTAGWLALSAAYGHPDAIVLPEVKTDIRKLTEIAAEAYERQRHAVIVIAEGAEFEGAEQTGDEEVDSFGHKRLEGSSAWAAEQIKESLGVVVNHVIPAYLQEQYPKLDSVEDLKDQQYKDLFTTAETGDKARLVSCIIGWACETVNAAQVEGYGLSDHVEIINPGDGAALNADLYGAYERGEPWLGYQWGTNDPSLKLDLVRLTEPAYSDQCWFTTKACAYEDATILIAVNPDLPGRAPEIIEMLRNWDFNIDIYKAVVRWQGENPDADVNSTALWWLNNNADIWGGWVTDEAGEAIQAALTAGEKAEGWPTE